jgi:ketose-bisphosphate aldolase
MPYFADGRTLIKDAYQRRYALPAFNVCSLEMARACLLAAEAERAPVILQTYPGDLEHASAATFAAMVRALAEEVSVPVTLHLDHGDGLARVATCLRAGYGSVMLDGEALPLEDNIRLMRRAAELTRAVGVALEAAAGSFGGGEGSGELHLTEPAAAARLRHEGGADMVACSVGSKHGQASRLDLERLQAIAEAMQGPMVLHGGSGIAAEDLGAAVALGVVKVNIGAALYRAMLATWRAAVPQAPLHYPVYTAVRKRLIDVVREKFQQTGAAGKASLIEVGGTV